MTLQTPLGRARGLGSSGTGTGHFWWQRLTSLFLVVLTAALIAVAVMTVGADHAAVRALLAEPVVAVVVLLFVLSTVYHMCIGMQVIIEDYVHGELLRIALLAANILASIAIAVASVFAVLKISFGA